MAAVVVCILFLSDLYISGHLRHSCTGENCPVCAQLRAAQSLVRQIGSGLMVLLLMTGVFLELQAAGRPAGSLLVRRTLVSQKVRLDD